MENDQELINLLNEDYSKYDRLEMLDYIDRQHKKILSMLNAITYELESQIIDGEEVSIDGVATRNAIKALHDPDQSFVKKMKDRDKQIIEEIKNNKFVQFYRGIIRIQELEEPERLRAEFTAKGFGKYLFGNSLETD